MDILVFCADGLVCGFNIRFRSDVRLYRDDFVSVAVVLGCGLQDLLPLAQDVYTLAPLATRLDLSQECKRVLHLTNHKAYTGTTL